MKITLDLTDDEADALADLVGRDLLYGRWGRSRFGSVYNVPNAAQARVLEKLRKEMLGLNDAARDLVRNPRR